MNQAVGKMRWKSTSNLPFRKPYSNSLARLTIKLIYPFLHFFSYIDYCVARIVSIDSAKLAANGGNVIESADVLIFAVFINHIADYSQLLLRLGEFEQIFETVVIVNSGSYLLANKLFWNPRTFVYDRENSQRDFGSYKFALAQIDLQRCKRICLINDSVYWSEGAILKFIQKAELLSAPIVGLTKSFQHVEHLQSYCLLFKKPTEIYLTPILNLPPVRFKRTIVIFGEMKLSKFLNNLCIKFEAIWDTNSLLQEFTPSNDVERSLKRTLLSYRERNIELNPSIHFAIPLFRQTGILKKVILKDNPAQFSPSILQVIDKISL